MIRTLTRLNQRVPRSLNQPLYRYNHTSKPQKWKTISIAGGVFSIGILALYNFGPEEPGLLGDLTRVSKSFVEPLLDFALVGGFVVGAALRFPFQEYFFGSIHALLDNPDNHHTLLSLGLVDVLLSLPFSQDSASIIHQLLSKAHDHKIFEKVLHSGGIELVFHMAPYCDPLFDSLLCDVIEMNRKDLFRYRFTRAERVKKLVSLLCRDDMVEQTPNSNKDQEKVSPAARAFALWQLQDIFLRHPRLSYHNHTFDVVRLAVSGLEFARKLAQEEIINRPGSSQSKYRALFNRSIPPTETQNMILPSSQLSLQHALKLALYALDSSSNTVEQSYSNSFVNLLKLLRWNPVYEPASAEWYQNIAALCDHGEDAIRIWLTYPSKEDATSNSSLDTDSKKMYAISRKNAADAFVVLFARNSKISNEKGQKVQTSRLHSLEKRCDQLDSAQLESNQTHTSEISRARAIHSLIKSQIAWECGLFPLDSWEIALEGFSWKLESDWADGMMKPTPTQVNKENDTWIWFSALYELAKSNNEKLSSYGVRSLQHCIERMISFHPTMAVVLMQEWLLEILMDASELVDSNLKAETFAEIARYRFYIFFSCFLSSSSSFFRTQK